uniref:Reverse transcriptase zinc-binding domain-containing protein n=1 Tax=Nicotiana tabacum TaxID=4097 RepID=A0A1S4CBS0_TOBAC|nr:uncharacterized protein LOC104121050 [Nicotiana tomentosiformis]XP_016498566.1 PREDICTED: uncharacterized protein LOC107817282 [Nicotiana tabacum]
MEYLSRNLKTLKHEKAFHYHPMCSRLDLTHLSFAYDLLLFARGDVASVTLLHDRFNIFLAVSGLKANLAKSFIYYGGVSLEVKHDIQQKLGCSQGSLPFRYLGIPLDTKNLSVMQWQPLVDKIMARISSWTSKKLSYAGKIQLVQHVIFGIQAYWVQIFIIPAKVVKAIDAYCRSYVWSRENIITKKALVDQVFATIGAPKQASWMVRKILGARGNLDVISNRQIHQRNVIKQVYLQMLEKLAKVSWKGLMYQNQAQPKAIFSIWLQVQGRLLIADRLKN